MKIKVKTVQGIYYIAVSKAKNSYFFCKIFFFKLKKLPTPVGNKHPQPYSCLQLGAVQISRELGGITSGGAESSEGPNMITVT